MRWGLRCGRRLDGAGHQVGGGGVVGDLLRVLAAGDDAGDGRVLQDPGESPPRHRHALKHFVALDLFDLAQRVVGALLGVPLAADLGLVEPVAGLVLAGEVAGGEGDTGEDDTPDDDEANLRHGHVNIEVPDSTGALRARLEIKLIDPVTGRIGTDKSAIRTHMADLEVQVGRGGEQLRIVGSAERDKDLTFATEVGGTQPRWTLRAGRTDAHLELRRYLSDDRYQDSPLRVNRYTGEVALGGADGTSAGVTVRQDGGVALTVLPLARGGQGILVAGPAGDRTARALQSDVTGDAMRRFVVLVDGTLQWGDGTADRDTRLYRRAAGQLATDGSVFLRDVATPPRPSGGGVLFVSNGALRYRGSAGTVTTLAPA